MLLQGRCQERGRLNTDTKETEYDGYGDCVDTEGDEEERRRRCINSHHGQKTENLDFFFFFSLLSGKEKEF